MASSASIMPFLPPLRAPRAATLRQFLRLPISTRCYAEAALKSAQIQTRAEDPNLVASRFAAPMYPPPTMVSDPRPKVSRASRRTSHPRQERPAQKPLNLPSVQHVPDAQCAPNLPYFVTRTSNHELPVYHDRKKGGNQLWTLIKKVDGQKEVLRDEIRKLVEQELVQSDPGRQKEVEIKIGSITGHIKVKGWHKDAIVRYLRERKF